MAFEKRENTLSFFQNGAIDFKEQFDIEISNTKKEGFKEIINSDLYLFLSKAYKENKFNIQMEIDSIFNELNNYNIYYKCTRIYKHSHSYYGSHPLINKIELTEFLNRSNKLTLLQ